MSVIEKALEKARQRGRKPIEMTRPVSIPGAAVAAPGASLTAVRGTPSRRMSVNMERLRAQGMIPPTDAQRRLAAQMRVIKFRLLQAAVGGSSARDRVIMVTSALSGDGKTFNCISLALSLATERDFHVLLVDGDMPKPNLGQLFGVEGPGLLDLAREPSLDPEQLIVGTDLPGLDLLPAGRSGVDAAEILSSNGMRDVIARLSAVPDRIVLLDSPPLLQTSEAAVLSQHAGQVLMVVRDTVTPQRALQDALVSLGERKGISLLLNGVTDSKLEEYYYGYGNYYGYGEQEAEPTREREAVGG